MIIRRHSLFSSPGTCKISHAYIKRESVNKNVKRRYDRNPEISCRRVNAFFLKKTILTLRFHVLANVKKKNSSNALWKRSPWHFRVLIATRLHEKHRVYFFLITIFFIPCPYSSLTRWSARAREKREIGNNVWWLNEMIVRSWKSVVVNFTKFLH